MRPTQKGGPTTEALGYSRGGFSTKIHVCAEGYGKPMTFVLTPGQQHESTIVRQPLVGGRVHRAGPGRPRHRPRRLVADKGYSYPHVRRMITRMGMGVFPIVLTVPGAPGSA